jgi:hypothetical protein
MNEMTRYNQVLSRNLTAAKLDIVVPFGCS